VASLRWSLLATRLTFFQVTLTFNDNGAQTITIISRETDLVELKDAVMDRAFACSRKPRGEIDNDGQISSQMV